ncbi:hypothetical protein L210DRAFT_14928 [Boletus edulis BED1]|uniref:Uncharacterized protein n=1 Tax=Boletus edulis BED1 TaxID=1328754 RepID=A0AAD4BE30_BOLED|nr:hypothetical protein L210DRAFT_14928 [Boletus edulis BED1]
MAVLRLVTETNTANHFTFVHDFCFTTRVPLERTGRPCNCLTPTPTPKGGQGIERCVAEARRHGDRRLDIVFDVGWE